jgi:hypothetical protein
LTQNIVTPGNRSENNVDAIDKFKQTLISTRTGSVIFDKINSTSYWGKEKDYRWTANSFKDMIRSCRSKVNLFTEKTKPDNENEYYSPQAIAEIKDLKKFGDQMQTISLACDVLNIDSESPIINISEQIKSKKNTLLSKDGNVIDPRGYYDHSKNTVEITTSFPDIFSLYLHEYFHSIEARYSIFKDPNVDKKILGNDLYLEWQRTGFVDNNSTIKGESLPKSIVDKLEKMGLKGYSLRSDSKESDLKKVKSLVIKLDELENSKSNFTENQYLSRKAALELELVIVKDNLTPPRELISTAIEALLITDDTKFNSAEVQAMLERYFDVIYSRSGNELFSPAVLAEWIPMIRSLNKSYIEKDFVKARQTVNDFWKKYPDLKNK